MVMEVAAQRSLAEAALEQEWADQRALKERGVNQIRKNQQRAMDSKAARDEEMAIKIQREKDEMARERERRDTAKKQQMIQDCKDDRAMMIQTKRQRLVDEKTLEHAEVEYIRENNRRARKGEEGQINTDYRTELGQSVQREWKAKQPDLVKKAKQRKEINDENDAYLAKINRMREEKLEILRRRGVPEKHLVNIKANQFQVGS
jgi:hypothetical protein